MHAIQSMWVLFWDALCMDEYISAQNVALKMRLPVNELGAVTLCSGEYFPFS